jgi:uncharacterized membrane protein YuzA (DUF378 family)
VKSSDSKKKETSFVPGRSGKRWRSPRRTIATALRLLSSEMKNSSPTPKTRAIRRSVGSVGNSRPLFDLREQRGGESGVPAELDQSHLLRQPQAAQLVADAVGPKAAFESCRQHVPFLLERQSKPRRFFDCGAHDFQYPCDLRWSQMNLTYLQTRRYEVMKRLDVLAAILVVVGAVNWGLVAVARFDLVAALFGMRFGEVSPLTAIVYGLVGLAGFYQAIFWKGIQRRWNGAPVMAGAR